MSMKRNDRKNKPQKGMCGGGEEEDLKDYFIKREE